MLSNFAMPSLVRLMAFFSAVLLGTLSLSVQAQSLLEAQRSLKQGKTVQALEQADAYIARNPKDPQGRFLKGVILTDMGKSAEAVTVFTKLTEDFPELPEPYNNLAVLYAQQKQYDKAKMALEMAIKTHPSYFTAHENLGDLYAKMASQAYGKALQIDSANASTQTKLSMITEMINPVQGKPAVTASTESAKVTIQPAQVAAAKPEKDREVKEGSKTVPLPPVSEPQSAAKEPVQKTVEPTVQESVKAKPSASEKSSSASTANTEEQVKLTLQNWADAWSRKDVKAYLAFYAKNFEIPAGMSRKGWEAERRKRIDKPGKLQVSLSNVRVDVVADKATAKFRQRYVSPTFKSNASKTVRLEKNGGNWQIVQELAN